MDNHSRAILSRALTRTQDLVSYPSVLYEVLGIVKLEIERGRLWQSYTETMFSIVRRMADWHFSQAEIWRDLVEAHDGWVEDCNAQRLFAHLEREAGRGTPSEVLGFVSRA